MGRADVEVVPGPDPLGRAPRRRRARRVAAAAGRRSRRRRSSRPTYVPALDLPRRHRGARAARSCRRSPSATCRTSTPTAIALRRVRARRPRPGEGLVLPELAGLGRRRPLPGDAEPDGGDPHRHPRRAVLRLDRRRRRLVRSSPASASPGWCSCSRRPRLLEGDDARSSSTARSPTTTLDDEPRGARTTWRPSGGSDEPEEPDDPDDRTSRTTRTSRTDPDDPDEPERARRTRRARCPVLRLRCGATSPASRRSARLVTAVDVGLFLRPLAGRPPVGAPPPTSPRSWPPAPPRGRCTGPSPSATTRTTGGCTQHEAFVAAGVAGAAVDVAVTVGPPGPVGRRGPAGRPGGQAARRRLPAPRSAGCCTGGCSSASCATSTSPGPDERPLPGTVRLSVVVPAYREAGRIGGTVRRLRAALGALDGGVEIVVVDDGLGRRHRRRGPRGRGRPGRRPARRTGAREPRCAPACWPPTGAPSRSPTPTSPTRPSSSSGCSTRSRRAGTWSSAAAATTRPPRWCGPAASASSAAGSSTSSPTSVLLGAYRDTQCGLKAFRSDAARAIFERSRRSTASASTSRCSSWPSATACRSREVPVQVENSERSTVQVVRGRRPPASATSSASGAGRGRAATRSTRPGGPTSHN